MRNTLVSAMLAALASCKGENKLAGAYTNYTSVPRVKDETRDIPGARIFDTIKVSKAQGKNNYHLDRTIHSVEVSRQGHESTEHRKMKGHYDRKDKTIKLDGDNGTLIVRPKSREIINYGTKFRKISR